MRKGRPRCSQVLVLPELLHILQRFVYDFFLRVIAKLNLAQTGAAGECQRAAVSTHVRWSDSGESGAPARSSLARGPLRS